MEFNLNQCFHICDRRDNVGFDRRKCRTSLGGAKLRGLFAVDREDDPDKGAHMGIPANSRDVLYHTGLGQTG